MPTKQPPRVQFNYEPELTDVITEEINPNFVYPDGEEGTEDHDISMEIEDSMHLPSIEKEDIVEHDIFQQQALPRTAPKQQQTRPQQVILEQQPQQPQQQQRVKGVNKNGKPRKPMSEEHKAKLAMAREKAQIARKAKAQERKNDRLLDTEEKELIKKQKVKRVKKLKEEVEDDETEVIGTFGEPQQQRQQRNSSSGLTMEDIQKAQMDAIMAYENVRKARKEEKKKSQMIEQQKTDMIRKIQQAQPQSYTYRARDTSGRLVNKFDNCY